MTRETKVGLLIGLGLILFIGIIVSDHLSQVTQSEPGALTQAANRAQRSINDLPYANQAANATPGQRAQLEVQEQTPSLQQQQPNQTQRTIPTPQEVDQLTKPAEGMFGRNLPMVTAVDAQPANGTTTQHQTLPAPAVGLGSERTPPINTPTNTPTNTRTTVPTILPQPREGAQIIHYVKAGESVWALAQKYLGDGRKWTLLRDQNPNAISSKGVLAANARLVIPNQLPFDDQFDAGALDQSGATRRTRRITVKSGDTFSVLAQRHLGSSRLWPKLLAANRDLVNQPEDLRVGMSIVIPALTTMPSRSTDTAAPTGHRAPSARTYIVKAGDNLSRIAAKKLGDTSRWDEIYQANKDQLQNPDDLRVGQKLRIPS